MNYNHDNRIDEILNYGFNFDLGKYISEGFEIVKNAPLPFIAYTLLIGLILFFGSMIPFMGSFLAQVIAAPFLAGYLIVAHKVARNEIIDFGDFFTSFDYFAPLLLQAIIVLGFTIALYLPLVVISIAANGVFLFDVSDFDGIMSVFVSMISILLLCLYVYMMASLIFAQAFVVFSNMGAWEAMITSQKVISKNFFSVLGFFIILGLLVFGGYMLCCVGLLLTLPLYQASIFAAFKDVMKLDDPSNGKIPNDVYDHLID